MKILIQAAFKEELSPFVQSIPHLKPTVIAKRRCLYIHMNGNDIYIALTGIGVASAAMTTTALCEVLNPDTIIMCGCAGGLKADQEIGDIIIGKTIIDIDLYHLHTALEGTPYQSCLINPHTDQRLFKAHPSCPDLQRRCLNSTLPRVSLGNIVTTNIFPSPKDLFETINTLDCSAIEMEGSGVITASAYYNTPTIIIRSISNFLDNKGNDLGTKDNALDICASRLCAFLLELLF